MDNEHRGLALTLADAAAAQAAASSGTAAKTANANNGFASSNSGAISNVAQSVLARANGFTPKVSGKVLVQFTCIVSNGAVSTTGITPAVGHSLHGGTPTADTTASAAVAIPAGTNGEVAFQWFLPGLTVGTSYDLAAMAQASQVGANVADCRLYVQELVA